MIAKKEIQKLVKQNKEELKHQQQMFGGVIVYSEITGAIGVAGADNIDFKIIFMTSAFESEEDMESAKAEIDEQLLKLGVNSLTEEQFKENMMVEA